MLDYAIEQQRCDELFRLLFSERQFTNLQDIADMNDIDEVYRQIVKKAIEDINHSIRLSHKELVLINGHFMIVEVGKALVIETPKLNIRSIPYVQGFRERCNDDFNSGNYDSVITKSRTTMEEVLVQLLEENNVKQISKGDLLKLYNQVKTLFNMQQKKKTINESIIC